MKPGSVAIVGAAETERLGKIPDMSAVQLNVDAALRALDDCGLSVSDVDGVAAAGVSPIHVAHYLGITPAWVDSTSVGGCSYMLHVRHAAAAISAGMCSTVLITHGESGRSRVGQSWRGFDMSSVNGQFEMPYGVMGPPTLFTLPVLRYLHETGTTLDQLASVAVVQREWAARNPRALMRDPITVDDVFASKVIAWPFHLLMCCLVTDGGGALVVTSAERARDLPRPPVYVLGTGESAETPVVSQMEDFTTSKAFRVSGRRAFASAGIGHDDVDHLMAYDAFAHLPIFALEDLGFCERGEAGAFIEKRNTAPGGRLPLNTNGGGLSYTHTGMYGMFAIQESVRQLRGEAPAQVEGVEVSVAHGVGGMFMSAGTLVLSNRQP